MPRITSLLLVFTVAVGTIGYLIYHNGRALEQKETAAVQSAFKDIETDSAMQFEIADTATARMNGLSGRSDVPHDYGMLFVFPNDGVNGFWMKDMLVPIDIIWLSDTSTILGIEDSVMPNTYPHVFYPPEPVRYVLETRAGESALKGWHVGTQLQLPL